MIRGLYAPNHRRRREQALLDSEGRCSNPACRKWLGRMKLSRNYNLCFDLGHLHHPNGDPENPDAVVQILCDSCHMRAHRQKEKSGEKAAPHKKGYEVVRTAYLLERLAGAGLRTQTTEGGRLAWQLGSLEGEAEDALDVVLTAFHWMSTEIASLTTELELARSPKEK
jgi:hypothetical protein